MSHYRDGTTKSSTPEEVRDLWMTPLELFRNLTKRWRFGLDAAAEHNKLCSVYYSAEDDALSRVWSDGTGSVWCNNPYSLTAKFIEHGRYQSAILKRPVVFLIPVSVGVKWFHRHVAGVADEVWFFEGRVHFTNEATMETEKSTNFESMLVCFNGKNETGETYMGSISNVGHPSSRSRKRWYTHPLLKYNEP